MWHFINWLHWILDSSAMKPLEIKHIKLIQLQFNIFQLKRDCKRNFKWTSCKDDNARFTTVPFKALSHQVWIIYPWFSTLNIFFHLRFLCERDLLISCLLEAMEKYLNLTLFKSEKNAFFHIIDQIKVGRLLSGFRHWHLWKEGNLKLRLQSL